MNTGSSSSSSGGTDCARLLSDDACGLATRLPNIVSAGTVDVDSADGVLCFTLHTRLGGARVSVVVGTAYPDGEPFACLGDDAAPVLLRAAPRNLDAWVSQVAELATGRLRQKEEEEEDKEGQAEDSADEDEMYRVDDDDDDDDDDEGYSSADGSAMSTSDGGGGDAGDDAEADASAAAALASTRDIHADARAAVATHPYATVDVDRRCVRLGIDPFFLTDFQLAAMALRRGSRLVVELAWGDGYLSSAEVPSVRSVAVEEGEAGGGEGGGRRGDASPLPCDGAVGWFLTNRLEAALRRNWLHKEEGLRAAVAAAAAADAAGAVGAGAADPAGRGIDKLTVADKRRIDGAGGGGEVEVEVEEEVGATALLPVHLEEELQEKAATLRGMGGWSLAACYKALAGCGVSTTRAATLLSGGRRGEGEEEEEAAAVPSSSTAEEEEAHWLRRCRRVVSVGSGLVQAEEASAPQPCTYNASAAFECRYENFFEGGNANALSGLLRYVKYRLLTACRVCAICDDPLGFACVRTAVCGKATCAFALEELGVGCSVASDARSAPGVVELQIALSAASAACSLASEERLRRMTFDPWCVGIEGLHALHNQEGDADAAAAPNLALISALYRDMPSARELGRLGGEQAVREVLGRVHPLCYPLLRWTLTSSRTHVMELGPGHRVPGVGGLQYVLCASSPEREREFRARRAAVRRRTGGPGSFYAWHGSQKSNWHSIVRRGLQNYSNTEMMSRGAAHGAGVYLARSSAMAKEYTGRAALPAGFGDGDGGGNRAIPNGFTAMALCEVVDERGVEGGSVRDANSAIVVAEDGAAVCTRFFFVFPGDTSPPQNLKADEVSLPTEIVALFNGA